MKIKKTYLELINFNQVAAAYLDKNKEAENKLCSAIKQFSKQLKNIFEEYNDERDNLQLNNCLVYMEGQMKNAVMKDEKGNRMFSVEGEKKLKKELKELIYKEVECHARIPESIDALLPTLTEIELEVFNGIIIPEQQKLYDDAD